MKKTATKDSWTTHPLPEKHTRSAASWSFTGHEFGQMKRGLIPEQMEDKWFIYHSDGLLHFHRSWTGYCIYQVKFRERGSNYEIARILVSRDVEQYRESSDKYDLMLLKYLIDCLLLGKAIEFPQREDVSDDVTAALYQHHLVGRGHKSEG